MSQPAVSVILARMEAGDPFELERFLKAQDGGAYERACAELRAGRKRDHWMWFIFPQLRGLGQSAMSRHYGLSGLGEAAAYLAHPFLGARLKGCTQILLDGGQSDARAILGSPDDLKLCSCMTLFAQLDTAPEAFSDVLDRFFDGQEDRLTLALLRQ